jgi:hypothetical protein
MKTPVHIKIAAMMILETAAIAVIAAGCMNITEDIRRRGIQSEALKKEFRQWLEKELLPNMTAAKLIAASHDTIDWHLGGNTYVTGKNEPKDFIPDYFEFMKRDWTDALKPDCKSCSIYEDIDYTRNWEYPVITLSLFVEDGEQARYSFMRTGDEFKLFHAIIRDHKATVIHGRKVNIASSSDSDSEEPKVKRIYFSYGSEHKLASVNMRHCADIEYLNVHVETENYRDGDTVDITIKIDDNDDNFCGLSFDGALELKLSGIVSENEVIIEDVLRPYIK